MQIIKNLKNPIFSRINKRTYILMKACRDNEAKTAKVFGKAGRKIIIVKSGKEIKILQGRLWRL